MKTGLVVEGGGMKCAYTSGILDRLLDDKQHFEYAIGVSAGSSSTASFLAGQRDRNRRFFVDHITDPGYMGLSSVVRNKSFFGLDYIYMDMTSSHGVDPLDYDTMMSSGTDFRITATDAETGKPHYFRKEEIKKDDYRYFMATCALPVMCKPVEIDGRNYFDGGCSDSIPYKKALADGCDRIVVILCRPTDTVRVPEKHMHLIRRRMHKYPNIVDDIANRHNSYNKQLSGLLELKNQGKAFIFAPKVQLDITTYTKDQNKLQSLYDMSIDDYNTGDGAAYFNFMNATI